jgi:hypothetical protein
MTHVIMALGGQTLSHLNQVQESWYHDLRFLIFGELIFESLAGNKAKVNADLYHKYGQAI